MGPGMPALRSILVGRTLAVGLAIAMGPAVTHAASIQKCQSKAGEVLFTSVDCPEGYQLVRQHAVEDPPPAPDAAGAEEAIDLDALPPQAERPPPEEPPGLIQRAMLAARFTRALSELSTLKTYSMMHLAETGEWPRGPADLGLDPQTFDTEDIAAIDFAPDGAIIAHLRADFGSERRIWLRPEASLGGATTRWVCETNVRIGQVLPGMGVSCDEVG